jgi:hypothetical protein
MKASFSSNARERVIIAVVALFVASAAMVSVFSLFLGGSGGAEPADTVVKTEPDKVSVARAAAPVGDRPESRDAGPPGHARY